MVWAAVVGLALLQANYFDQFDVTGYQFNDVSGGVWTVELKDVKRSLGTVTAWIKSEHSNDKSVEYRQSVRRVYFDCNGNYRVTAITNYDANGKILFNWDGYGTMGAIRPDTVFESFESRLCEK